MARQSICGDPFLGTVYIVNQEMMPEFRLRFGLGMGLRALETGGDGKFQIVRGED